MNVIITGASKGIGKAIAARFAAGHHNLVLCARSGVQLYKTMEELQTRYPDVVIKSKTADLNEPEAVIDFGQWALEETARMPGGGIDVLVNNAGQFLPGSIADEAEGTLEQMIGVNLYAAYRLTRKLLPAMISRKSGYIFNMCSVASIQSYANGGSYSISKFALLGFTKNLREEMKPHGIKVTAVIPGAVYTDSWEGSGVPASRMMEANDIAEIVYTCSQLSPGAAMEEIVVRPQLGDL